MSADFCLDICLLTFTLDIKTPMQLIYIITTLNVKGAACDLFYVSMGINHAGEIYIQKYWSYSLNSVSRGKRVIYHGKEYRVTDP